ncbi:DUF2956 domain-containing protein [Paraglaciecola arctica]|uniref:DUF2956 domain-containing protein n=1 Tax=Paraglaciecola arctica TaxID=1128911 RepID=UPI001C06A99A|nr:DUF2956 domain-containing protein [Paraglaciecola arctica]MBU3001963.1 DUF2956 domain-containing protein [Paraglaciecola arctica]
MKNNVSPEVAASAMKIAKGTQKVGQTKAQTKLIAQGIEKGVAEYKKQQAKKLRELDKQRKQKAKQQPMQSSKHEEVQSKEPLKPLPWILLGLSWLGFAVYIFI